MKSAWEWIREVWLKCTQFATAVLASAWVGAIVTCLILVAGLVGSLYTTEAKDAVKKWEPIVDEHWKALVIGSLLTSAILFFLRQRALDVLRDESQKRLESATQTLENLVRTQPPVEFQQTLGVCYEKALVGCDGAETSDELVSSIAVVLEGLAQLAQVFDNGPIKEGYGANVMVFLEPAEAAAWFDYIKFLEEGVALSNLLGLLALCPQLSAHKSGKAASKSPDPGLKPFALPVPKNFGESKEKKGAGWRILPGGPRAYVHRRFEHFCPTSELADWCEKHGDFNKYLVAQITEYFDSARDSIQGFCSMPLFRPSESFQPQEQREVIAVLNVHWSGARLLDQPDSANTFGEATFPMRVLLARQLIRLFKKAGKPHPTTPATTTPPPPTTAPTTANAAVTA